MIISVFVAVLNRPPADAEVLAWSEVLAGDDEAIIRTLARNLRLTPEFDSLKMNESFNSAAYWRFAYEIAFQGALGRSPLKSELAQWNPGHSTALDPMDLVNALRVTEEFHANLVTLASMEMRKVPDSGIFFLHVPKCGGTSISFALSEALGLRALSLRPFQGRGLGAVLPVLNPGMYDRWPLQTGHIHLDFFPPSFSGFSVVREPRTRLLSLYRFVSSRSYQQQNEVDGNKREAVTSFQWRKKGPSMILWPGADTSSTGNGSFAWMFASGLSSPEAFESADRQARVKALSLGLDRLQGLAWLHDSSGVESLLHSVTGRPVNLGKENVTVGVADEATWTLNEEFMRRLDAMVEWDWIFLNMAIEKGLLPDFPRDKANESFMHSAQQMGFRFV